ncbi:flagellar motor switch/type III secretory pathway protein FliN [Breoghania corrubedonensis]|uniref:Flagellar motor switch/type III secretory pathway protein FliN n=1 Tax=Breoghania corrubedonensis TaxID=665038 RepID=A0A2T5UYR3_9HYPH|nr:FliM/FliN family flagellar motor switch protein [Breoghania corrubedonensis]PTW56644.1 flagellar motor switch/type III secretory pathway protein FliN [Breoghania corrubedonensis]
MNAPAWQAETLRLELEDVPVWNALMSHADQPVTLSEKNVTFSFRPTHSAPRDGWVRQIGFGGKSRLYLQVEQFPFATICGVELDVGDLAEMPPDLCEALQQGMAWTLVGALPGFLAEKASLDGSIFADRLSTDAGAAAAHWFSCSLSGFGDMPILFSIGASPDDICSLLRNAPPSARQVHSQLRSRIRTPVLRLAGEARLAARDIRALEAGDVVLFRELARAESRALLANGHVYTFDRSQQDWQCLSITPFSGDETMETDAAAVCEAPETGVDRTPENGPEDATDVEQAGELKAAPPVLMAPVSFALGSALLALNEIETWQVGATVPLPAEISADSTRVTLRVHDQVIAEGDLVRIADRLAARLTRVFLNDS